MFGRVDAGVKGGGGRGVLPAGRRVGRARDLLCRVHVPGRQRGRDRAFLRADAGEQKRSPTHPHEHMALITIWGNVERRVMG